MKMTSFFPLLFILACSGSHPQAVRDSKTQFQEPFQHVEAGRVNRPDSENSPYVVVVSLDGFRHDYPKLHDAKNLVRLGKQGVVARSWIPVFPSKTYVSHYSMVTGLSPEKSGIIANQFYDPSRKEEDQNYRLANRRAVEDASWYSGTPLWVAAEKSGLLSATFFWPGSEAPIGGVRPSFWYPYDEKVPNAYRVSQVIRWLKLAPERRPHLIFLYFSDVDTAGHFYGPESGAVREAVQSLDATLGVLSSELQATGLPIHLIVLSDHGMQSVPPKNVEYLADYANLEGARFGDFGPVVSIYSSDEKVRERIYRDLKKHAKHFRVFRRNEVPVSFHYRNSNRIGDLVLIADSSWTIAGARSDQKDVSATIPRFVPSVGQHGYDPKTNRKMHGIFLATGPRIRPGQTVPSIESLSLYPFVLKLLGIPETQKVDGKLGALEKVIHY